MDKTLTQLVDKINKAFGSKVVSVILYGSGADGEIHKDYSDLNVLCVLTQVTSAELAVSGGIFRFWREKGNPAPLLMSEEEVQRSTDAFPIEFKDMQANRKVLVGKDVIASLEVSSKNYRTQIEHELRSKMLRLRQKAAGVWDDDDLLGKLMVDSSATFVVLARHALSAAGHPVQWKKRDAITELKAKFGIDPEPFYTLLDLREGVTRKLPVAATQLFDRYLAQIQVLVQTVDHLEN
jgi:hypothetical protein